VTLALLTGCGSPPLEVPDDAPFETDAITTDISVATPEVIRLYEANLRQKYLIGPGDVVKVVVWNREKLSGVHVVGPYGFITLPLLGEFKMEGLGRGEAAKKITQFYSKFYDKPIVTVSVEKYLNNKIYVLGRVTKPGVVYFDGIGTLLEAISLAGGLSLGDKATTVSKCYIVRGKEQIIWIDLQQLLLNANTKLNVQLANNDIIYFPESKEATVFVMGEVKNPGSYQIHRSGLSFLDAINLAGGPTENAKTEELSLIRDMKEQEGVKIVDLDRILAKGDFSQNYRLKDNDIIYLPRKGMAKVNYFLRQIDPFLRTFISGVVVYGAISDDNN
jgi:polysaccharide export outer membrane protein